MTFNFTDQCNVQSRYASITIPNTENENKFLTAIFQLLSLNNADNGNQYRVSTCALWMFSVVKRYGKWVTIISY